jgi:hypothetical protein
VTAVVLPDLPVKAWAVRLRWKRPDGTIHDAIQRGGIYRTRAEARAAIRRQQRRGWLNTRGGYGLVGVRAVRVAGVLTEVRR